MIIVNDNKEWEMEIPTIILKAYLIRETEDNCGEYMVQTNIVTDELKALDFIQKEYYFENIPTVFFTEDNLKVLLGFIYNADIKSIYINQDRDIKIKLRSGIMLNMEIF